jgi:sarcosine oxidase
VPVGVFLANSQSFPTDTAGRYAAKEIIHGSFVTSYDVIVIGTGGVGSAALFHLAQRGVKVLGLDRFPPGHDRGSSHGRTRIIRQAYFEHPDYVPLLLRAYELWDDLSQLCGKRLYHQIGLLQVSDPNGQIVSRVLNSARKYNLQVDELSADYAMARFPGFRFPNHWKAVFEHRAGYLDVEDCVLAHLQEAQKHGAELRTGISVQGWRDDRSAIVVETEAGTFCSRKLVIAAGPWAQTFLKDLGIGFEVRRKEVFWYPILDGALSADQGCPAFLFEGSRHVVYGIPQVDEWGLKIAKHTGGDVIVDPLNIDRRVNDFDREALEKFITAIFPNVGRPYLHHSVCLYTMTPGEDFVVDLHPRHPRVSFAAGLSGHGFKFTCVLGEALADLALNGRTELPIGFLNCRRFGTC